LVVTARRLLVDPQEGVRAAFVARVGRSISPPPGLQQRVIIGTHSTSLELWGRCQRPPTIRRATIAPPRVAEHELGHGLAEARSPHSCDVRAALEIGVRDGTTIRWK